MEEVAAGDDGDVVQVEVIPPVKTVGRVAAGTDWRQKSGATGGDWRQGSGADGASGSISGSGGPFSMDPEHWASLMNMLQEASHQ